MSSIVTHRLEHEIEDIIFNIESDNQKFLKDCHYKD